MSRKDYEVLARTHSREALLKYAIDNGVQWEESNHPGVNWMRASASIIEHLNNNKAFFTDNITPEIAQQLLDMYAKVELLHKKTMIPHLRSAMQKLKEEDSATASHSMDKLADAHIHLAANGGSVWADKIFILRTLHTQMKFLEERVQALPPVE